MKTPFGLCNSPTNFLRFIDEVFKDLIKKRIIFTYMNDVIVPAYDEKDAFNKLEKILALAVNSDLNISWKKCKFLQKCVEFLGHVIEESCVKPSPAKIKSVKDFPQPKMFKQYRAFSDLQVILGSS